jgi:hypothetical protein
VYFFRETAFVKIFHCDHCQQLVFFENIRCVNCGHALAYLPDLQDVGSLDLIGENRWRSPARAANDRTYRLCENYSRQDICNWAIPEPDANSLCQSCRLTRIIPDLSKPGHLAAWFRLESAKRRLVYSLLALKLPLATRADDPEHGIAFDFMADDPLAKAVVLTGHNEGVITLSIAEANDAEREKRRLQLHEPYRTLLGHFRHEIGHYYWDRLIKDSERLEDFRRLFGDEREDYGKALERHYQRGAPADWRQHFVSAYASAHAWEDWAETWAHFLHMVDTLETAGACGLSLRPRRADEPALKTEITMLIEPIRPFDTMIERWFPLTYVLNNLNRGLGMPDAYPFVLPLVAIDKLRFIHDAITRSSGAA